MTPARRRVLDHYTADAARFGVSPAEVAAYAHAMADTLAGRHLELRYAMDDLLGVLLAPVVRLTSWLTGRR